MLVSPNWIHSNYKQGNYLFIIYRYTYPSESFTLNLWAGPNDLLAANVMYVCQDCNDCRINMSSTISACDGIDRCHSTKIPLSKPFSSPLVSNETDRRLQSCRQTHAASQWICFSKKKRRIPAKLIAEKRSEQQQQQKKKKKKCNCSLNKSGETVELIINLSSFGELHEKDVGRLR